MAKTNISIVGAGAVGSFLAAELVLAHSPVQLLTHQKTTHNYTYQKNQLSYRIDCPSYLISAYQEPINTLILATKAYDARSALAQIQHCLTPKTQVVLVQNGLSTKEELMAHFPQYDYLNIVNTYGIWRRDETTVELTGHGELWLEPGCDTLYDALSKTSLSVNLDPHLYVRQWHKLGVNCAINGLSALYKCRNGELLDSVETLQRMQAICEEVEQVMQKMAIPLPPESLFMLARKVAKATANNYSSTFQDIKQKRTTEIPYLNGHLTRLGRSLGLSLPHNSNIITEITKLG